MSPSALIRRFENAVNARDLEAAHDALDEIVNDVLDTVHLALEDVLAETARRQVLAVAEDYIGNNYGRS
jgi:hypothetical protein